MTYKLVVFFKGIFCCENIQHILLFLNTKKEGSCVGYFFIWARVVALESYLE